MLFPHTKTRRTLLRHANPPEGVTAHDLLLKAELNDLPSAEVFGALYSKEVSAQFIVERRDTDRVVGYVSFHHLDLSGQHVRASFLTDPAAAGNGLGAEVILMTVNYAFAMWNVRKIYFWTTETDFEAFRTAFNSAYKEATLPEHLYDRGALRDVHIYAVYREQWEEHGAELLNKLAQGPGERREAASTASTASTVSAVSTDSAEASEGEKS
ncbi:GNAT family protein [Streptosporangium sp. NPDC006930]|uniref:GNAT family N-acetyltransferase n=1 Tax=unclassified Streptosporangium TaxID=2632669 RepID=UPI0034202EB9